MPEKYPKVKCSKCDRDVPSNNLKRHLNTCIGKKECEVCKKEFTPPNTKKGREQRTCSRSCSNSLFRSGENNPNWKKEAYRTTCFHHHGKKCVVCDEEKIVSVHHLNEDHSDNRPENLIPLCPTHHQYFHSRYRYEVEPIIQSYLRGWIKTNGEATYGIN